MLGHGGTRGEARRMLEVPWACPAPAQAREEIPGEGLAWGEARAAGSEKNQNQWSSWCQEKSAGAWPQSAVPDHLLGPQDRDPGPCPPDGRHLRTEALSPTNEKPVNASASIFFSFSQTSLNT